MAKQQSTPALPPRPPNSWRMALELRLPFEFGSLLTTWPLLRLAPRGDGHPVIVFPGLSSSDAATAPLRAFLNMLGYASAGWNQGYNFGPRAGVLAAARQQLMQTFERSGQKVSLLGWSLGGIYARELAKAHPEMVRSIITLGTPFAGSPQSTNAWRLYELTSGRDIHQDVHFFDLPGAPPVPTTSIYSRSDGVVTWLASIQAPCINNPHTENLEVFASHLGLGLNPSCWWAVANRLAQTEGQWRAFERQGYLHGLIYPDPRR